MSSLGRKSAGAGGAGGGGGGGGAAGGAEAEELAALDKTLARLAKALEKSSVRLDDKNELSEAIAPALQDAAEVCLGAFLFLFLFLFFCFLCFFLFSSFFFFKKKTACRAECSAFQAELFSERAEEDAR